MLFPPDNFYTNRPMFIDPNSLNHIFFLGHALDILHYYVGRLTVYYWPRDFWYNVTMQFETRFFTCPPFFKPRPI